MANFNTFGDLSTAPNTNTTIAGSNLAEQCNMNVVNDGIRALAAMGKGLGTFITTTGTDTYTATFAPVPDALATDFFYGVNFASTNTSTTPTFNPSGLGPKTITDMSGNALVAGALNGRHILIYDGTNFRVLNPAKFTPMSDATNGGLTVSAGTIALKPSDLLTKATPTTSDSIVIQDAAASNAAKTATIPAVVGALFSPITNSLGSDVAVNNGSLYFDGPSIAQGTTGTWFASGTVVLLDTSGAQNYNIKLWDGTTVISSLSTRSAGANNFVSASISGYLASPAGNIRISVNAGSTTTSKILFNQSGNSKDSTISAIRIA